MAGMNGRSRPRRVITFFGLMPNFPTAAAQRLWRALVRPGDLLLASVHLAPANGVDRAAVARAMEKVLPQYDNPENADLARRRPRVCQTLGRWCIRPASSSGKSREHRPSSAKRLGKPPGSLTFVRWGERFHVDPDRPLGIFQSLRYLPETFEVLVHAAGLRAERLCGHRLRRRRDLVDFPFFGRKKGFAFLHLKRFRSGKKSTLRGGSVRRRHSPSGYQQVNYAKQSAWHDRCGTKLAGSGYNSLQSHL